ncbi:MAG: protein kinase domain-containing protein [Streptosporangiaceae bacterium]
MLAGYRLEAQVGAGGMAVVFRARDQRLDRLVALKILAPALAADAAFRRRFIAESRAAAAVDDPHVIPVHEAGEASGVLFIAMRFVTGGDLRRVLEREGPLAPDRAAGFISPVASALDAAHRAGLVHRDIKPANILVDASPDRPDHVYLSDFGVSKGALSSVSQAGHFLGTPYYSAPEQIQGQAVDGRADQYALACVAWQMLTGEVPFERDQGMAVLLAHLSEPPPSLAGRRPDLSAATDEVLAKALAKVPEERYGSCREFADALREAFGLPSYTSPSASASGHPRTEISAQSRLPEPVAAAAGPADRPADAGAAADDRFPATVGALSRPAGAVGQAGGLAPELDTVTAAADGLPGTADVPAADQPVRAGPGPGADGAQSARRHRRRLLVIALACGILAAAVAVPLVLAAESPSATAPLAESLSWPPSPTRPAKP